MSLETFRKKIDGLQGGYAYDLAREDDRAYFLEKFEGEEHFRENYPVLYESFRKTVEERQKSNDGPENNCIGTLDNLQIEALEGENRADGQTYAVLSAPIIFSFIDSTKDVASAEPAGEWIGISIQTKIQEVRSGRVVARTSRFIPAANSYCGVVSSDPQPYDELMNKEYQTIVDIVGKDPAGNLCPQTFRKNTTLGETEEYNIVNISVTDPAPKTDVHIASNTIMMLYGRVNQQEIFQYADYKDGDYYNNVFQNNKVHLLLPITGELTYNYGIEPVGLYQPKTGQAFTRSEATYDYKSQRFIYRGDQFDGGMEDDDLYKSLRDCFTFGTYIPTLQAKVKFDIGIPEEGRSRLDWHTDVEGVANGDPKTIMLTARFEYEVRNSIGGQNIDMIQIQSVPEDRLAVIKREYYKFKPGSNTIYIPPITVYWGCLGKDTQILLSGGRTKRAEEIRTGDEVCGQDGRVLTVKDIVTGKDYTIFQIRTDNGASILASGGHPLMCGESCRRVCALRAGDSLALVGGGQSRITEISEVPYDDTVYSFVFEGVDEGVYMAADGFWAGDLTMQNTRLTRNREARRFSEEELAFLEEMERYHCLEAAANTCC